MNIFLDILEKQLILKGVITEDDWNAWRSDMIITFERDNQFAELKDAELLREKIQTLDQITNYVGEYFSKEWVYKNVLHMNDEDIENIKKEIQADGEEAEDEEEKEAPQPDEAPEPDEEDNRN